MSSTLTATHRSRHAPPGAHAGPLVVAVGEDGAHVLRAAATLAPVFGGRVHVFSAIEPLPVEMMMAGEPVLMPPEFEESRTGSRLGQLSARLTEVRDGHRWQVEVEHGDPVTSLVRRARALDAALIAIGIGRHRPMDRILAGEITLRVIRRTSCPVLAVAGELAHRPRVVVVGTDFSPQSLYAAETVLPLLEEGAVVHVVHVWQPSAAGDPTVFAVEDEYARTLPGRLDRFVAALHVPDGVTVRSEVREGRCVSRLLAFAEEHHADLIVAGRQGINPIARFFIGSVTTSLLRGATCSVLVTPEPSLAELDRIRRALGGTSESRKPHDWAEQLDGFTRRNTGRRTKLEVDDPAIGAQTQETGYPFVGASYDAHDRRVELMLGESHAGRVHLSRSIGGVDSVAVVTEPSGRDAGLRIGHGSGQTLLTFVAEP
jgi:nucleotide-binding universal stress UspA family protein